jgi:hypothetical protein
MSEFFAHLWTNGGTVFGVSLVVSAVEPSALIFSAVSLAWSVLFFVLFKIALKKELDEKHGREQ